MIPMELKEHESGKREVDEVDAILGKSKRIGLVKLVYHRRLPGRLVQTKLELRCLMIFWAQSKPLQRGEMKVRRKRKA